MTLERAEQFSAIEPTSLLTVGGILTQDFPHTPLNLGLPVVFPPGQRPVSFYLLVPLTNFFPKCLSH